MDANITERTSSVNDDIRPQKISPEDYPGEVKRCIMELRKQRGRIFEELGKIDQERVRLQNDIRILTDRLAKISIDQAQKTQYKIELEKTIQETETAYAKLIETSKGLYKTVNETKKSLKDPESPSRTEMKSVMGMAPIRSPGPGTEESIAPSTVTDASLSKMQ